MNEEVTNRFITHLGNFIQRPKMYASINDYWAFDCYLLGLFDGFRWASKIDYYSNFLKFLDSKFPRRKKELGFSAWLYYLNDSNENKAREQLEKLLLEYCEELKSIQ